MQTFNPGKALAYRGVDCRVLLWAENAAGRPAAGRNDVHCAVVAVTVDVFGRACRPKCGQRLHQTDGLTAGSCCGPKMLLAGQRPAATTFTVLY